MEAMSLATGRPAWHYNTCSCSLRQTQSHHCFTAAQQSLDCNQPLRQLFVTAAPEPDALGNIWLDVPIVEKDDAKRKGAKWNMSTSKWYVPAAVAAQKARSAEWFTEATAKRMRDPGDHIAGFPDLRVVLSRSRTAHHMALTMCHHSWRMISHLSRGSFQKTCKPAAPQLHRKTPTWPKWRR